MHQCLSGQLKDRSTKRHIFLTIHASLELDERWKNHGKPIERGVDITISHFDNLIPLASMKPTCAKAGPIGFKCRGTVWSTLSVGIILSINVKSKQFHHKAREQYVVEVLCVFMWIFLHPQNLQGFFVKSKEVMSSSPKLKTEEGRTRFVHHMYLHIFKEHSQASYCYKLDYSALTFL